MKRKDGKSTNPQARKAPDEIDHLIDRISEVAHDAADEYDACGGQSGDTYAKLFWACTNLVTGKDPLVVHLLHGEMLRELTRRLPLDGEVTEPRVVELLALLKQLAGRLGYGFEEGRFVPLLQPKGAA